MFNKKFFLCCFFVLLVYFFIIPVSAVLKSDSAVFDLRFDTPISFVVEQDSSFLYLDVEFVMVPLSDGRQVVLSSSFFPDFVSFEDGVAKFRLNKADDIVLVSQFRVQTSKAVVPVMSKVDFPLKNLDPVFLEYVLPSDVFDVNEDINSLAVQLSQGNDDLFKVVFLLAEWVNKNVVYDLDTVSSDKLPASWVFEHRKGVCTEYSSLLISLLRSLGIPAREISGVAYTDSSLFPTGWGFHSWVEVYFPGYGWVSFDPTYGQFGLVDAGHIKLGSGSDAVKNSFSWRGRNVDVIPGETGLNVSILSKQGSADKSMLSVSLSVLEDEVSKGSFNFLRVDLQNNNDFYVAETLRLSGVDGLRFLSSRSKSLALGPGEKKSVYFVFEVTNKLSDNFMYTFPLRLFVGNQFFSSEIKVFKGSSIVLEEDVLLFLDEEKELVLGLRCEATPIIRVGESLLVSCDYLNDEGLLCLGDFCEFVNEDFYLSLEMFEPGFFSRPVLFESSKSGSSRLSFVKFLVIDNSSLDLSKTYQSDVINPSDIGFLNISLKKNSSSVPLNVSLFIVHDYFVEEMFFDSVDNEVVFIFNFPARNLKKGINEFLVNVTFVDVLGNQFFEELYLEVSVEGLSLLDEVDFFFRKVYFWFKNLW
ncbi:transglutaminase-like domain-containing protein [Candidatus Woesearchaeota archaeon]|nr:transglutaminase-like domain-containing protein [Candidatus Woesearchaeota archaeon]